MMVFFWTNLGIILIWQKFSGTWESDFKIIYYFKLEACNKNEGFATKNEIFLATIHKVYCHSSKTTDQNMGKMQINTSKGSTYQSTKTHNT